MKWVFFVLLAASLGLAAFIYVRERLPNPMRSSSGSR